MVCSPDGLSILSGFAALVTAMYGLSNPNNDDRVDGGTMYAPELMIKRMKAIATGMPITATIIGAVKTVTEAEANALMPPTRPFAKLEALLVVPDTPLPTIHPVPNPAIAAYAVCTPKAYPTGMNKRENSIPVANLRCCAI